MPLFEILILITAVFSGATASVVGFGIGSLLTPLFAQRLGMDVAIAAVALPHALATAFRCIRLRSHIDWPVLMRFGLPSAIAGLAGAFAYSHLSPQSLNRVLGFLLLLTAIMQLTGSASRWRPKGIVVAGLGLLSGLFGGLAGNQGGLRAAALTAFNLSPVVFVATATATGLLVDMARLPVYLWKAGSGLFGLSLAIIIASVGVLIGTLLGEKILMGLSPQRFRQSVAAAVGLLGVWFLVK